MKINWKRVNNHFKVFVLGVVLTLGYRAYQQKQLQKKFITSPQEGEEDRLESPGRQPFLDAQETFLNGSDTFSGYSETERAYAETLGGFMKDQFAHKPRIFCLVNGKRFVCLIQTERIVAEEEKQAVWKKAQELALSAIPKFPTVAIAFYRQEQRNGTLLVGGATEEYYLRKEGGPFTLYPYFEGVDAAIAKENK